MKALIAGASGLIGTELVKQLIDHPNYSNLVLLNRRKLDLEHAKVVQKVVDFDKLPTIELNGKFDVCYCTLGTTQKKSGKKGLQKVDFEYVLNLAQLCVKLGIKKFIVISSIGAKAKSGSFYLRTKGEMEEAVANMGIQSTYVLRPSLLLGKRSEFRFAEAFGFWFFRVLRPFMFGKLRKYRAVNDCQVASCMIDLANNANVGFSIIESDVILAY